MSGRVPARALAILILACLAVASGMWWKGGVESSSAYMEINTGRPSEFGAQLLYRGIKLPGVPIVFFKRYRSIVEMDRHAGVTIAVDYKGVGFNTFFAFYRDGTMAGTGQCMVEENGDQILHDIHNLKDGEFYDTNANLVSTVKNGTGIQTLFYSEGPKNWELHLKQGRRLRLTIWDKNGSISLDKKYDENS